MDPVRASDIHTEERNEGLSPVKVFVVMMTLLIAGAVWLSVVLKDDDRAASAPSPSPAITTPTAQPTPQSKEFFAQRLHELERIGQRIYETQNLRLLDQVYTVKSPTRREVVKDIHVLRRLSVTVEAHYKQLGVRLLRVSQSSATIRERARVILRFFSASGRDITQGSPVRTQVTHWILRRQDGIWLIQRGLTTDIRRNQSS